jgi:hypothetical protein
MGITINNPVNIDNTSIVDSSAGLTLGVCQGFFKSSLSPYTVIAGTWFQDTDYEQIYATANNAELSYPVWLPSGDLNFLLHCRTGTNAGILKFYINDVLIGTIDLYTATAKTHAYKNFDFFNENSGLKTLKIKIDGKNASSSNYSSYMYSFEVGQQ